MKFTTFILTAIVNSKLTLGQPSFPPYTQQCRDDAGPPFVDDAPGTLYHDGSAAFPVLKDGSCANPIQSACSSRGDAKTAYLEGPLQCNGNGWYCRIFVDENWPPQNLISDLNFGYCNQTEVTEDTGYDQAGHCHGSDDDSTYYWWLRDHWFRGYNGRLRCCCNWNEGPDALTVGRLVDRCDFRRLVTPTEDVNECRDANEDHGMSFEGGCTPPFQLNQEIPEDDDRCWEIQRFGNVDSGGDDEDEDDEDEDDGEDNDEDEEGEDGENDEDEGEDDEDGEDEDDEDEEDEDDEDSNEDGEDDEDGEPVSGASPTPLCFSGANTVEVKGRGVVRMDSLAIGDSVRVKGGAFSKVYSFGHYDPNVPAEYLQIYFRTNEKKYTKAVLPPLEISKRHMIFIRDGTSSSAIPASMLKLGDTLVVEGATNSSSTAATVYNIVTNIKRKGAYAPFTMSGDIVVSGVLASNYVSMMANDDYESGSLMHWIAHVFKAPHRVLCSLDFNICENEKYTHGISTWIYSSYHVARWMVIHQQCISISSVALFVFFLFAIIRMRSGLVIVRYMPKSRI